MGNFSDKRLLPFSYTNPLLLRRPDAFEEVYELEEANQILKNPEFDVQRNTLLYIHGYIEKTSSPTVQKIVKAYTERNDHNILVLDWSTLAGGLYPTAVRKSSEVSLFILEPSSLLKRTLIPVGTGCS